MCMTTTTTNHTIDDGNGNWLANGGQDYDRAYALAQRLANERGEAVSLYDGSISVTVTPEQIGTIHIAPSVGTPSTCCETEGALDYDVTLTIGDVETQIEVTLVPRQYDGKLDKWGEMDHWLSASGVAVLRRLSDDARRHVADEIVAACVAGESSEIEVEVR